MKRTSKVEFTKSSGTPARPAPSRRALRRVALALCVAATALPAPLLRAQEATPATAPASQPINGNGNGGGFNGAGGGTTRNATIGQTRPTTGALRNVQVGPQGLTFNFQDVSIDTILNELSQAAGFVVVKQTQVQGRVTLIARQPVSKEGAVGLLNTVLHNADLAAILQDNNILKIVRLSDGKRQNIPVRTGNDPTKIANSDELITQVIPLRFADATLLKTDLAPLIDSETPFTSNASSNVLIVTDTSANIKRLVTIVSSLDTSVADAVDVKVFPLKYADATSAATLINQVFANLNSARTQGSAEPGQGGGGAGGGFGAGAFGGGFGGGRGGANNRGGGNQGGRAGQQRLVTAAADSRTNSVVVSGQADTLAIVQSVVKELDANPAAEQTTFVYRLRNSQAVTTANTLNALFNGTAVQNQTTQDNATRLQNYRNQNGSLSGGGSGTTTANRGTGGTNRTTGGGIGGFAGAGGGVSGIGGQRFGALGQQASSLSGQVSIIADYDSNALLVRTSPENYEQVKAIIAEVDRPVAQVLIKVLIAEVSHRNNFDAGIQFSALNLRPSGNGQQGGTGFDLPVTSANGTGLVVQLLENNFTATIQALEQANRLDVLSRPYILASDNQIASITVGSEVPFIDSSRITDTGNQINTVDYRDVGILLDVIAHINPDGLVILDVAPEISTLVRDSGVPISEGVTAPIISKRSAQSRVSVQSGQTIVIGGLMQDQLNETISKVPLLGDIPGLGELFKRRSREKTKTELLIFLTPQIAARPDQLQGMGEDLQNGLKLLPNAVGPGVFQEHLEGLRRGAVDNPIGPSTQPALADPTTKPAPAQIYEENKVRGDRRNFDRPPEERKEPIQNDPPR